MTAKTFENTYNPLDCDVKRVEGLQETCQKCGTNHHLTFEFAKGVMILKQRVSEAIEKVKEYDECGEPGCCDRIITIDEFKEKLLKELGLDEQEEDDEKRKGKI